MLLELGGDGFDGELVGGAGDLFEVDFDEAVGGVVDTEKELAGRSSADDSAGIVGEGDGIRDEVGVGVGRDTDFSGAAKEGAGNVEFSGGWGGDEIGGSRLTAAGKFNFGDGDAVAGVEIVIGAPVGGYLVGGFVDEGDDDIAFEGGDEVEPGGAAEAELAEAGAAGEEWEEQERYNIFYHKNPFRTGPGHGLEDDAMPPGIIQNSTCNI